MIATNRVPLACAVCGATYDQHAYRAKTSKYCSKACWSRRNPPSVKTCEFCGVVFTTRDRRAKFCSRRCAGKPRIGPKSGNWRGGKSLDDERARLMPQSRAWRKAVMTRDGFTCTQCGATGMLHAHHIKPWANHAELRFDVSNGITLCESCHGKVHGKDFSNRRKKTCPRCSRSTTGRGIDGMCKSCAITIWHRNASLSPLQMALPFPQEPDLGP